MTCACMYVAYSKEEAKRESHPFHHVFPVIFLDWYCAAVGSVGINALLKGEIPAHYSPASHGR